MRWRAAGERRDASRRPLPQRVRALSFVNVVLSRLETFEVFTGVFYIRVAEALVTVCFATDVRARSPCFVFPIHIRSLVCIVALNPQ